MKTACLLLVLAGCSLDFTPVPRCPIQLELQDSPLDMRGAGWARAGRFVRSIDVAGDVAIFLREEGGSPVGEAAFDAGVWRFRNVSTEATRCAEVRGGMPGMVGAVCAADGGVATVFRAPNASYVTSLKGDAFDAQGATRLFFDGMRLSAFAKSSVFGLPNPGVMTVKRWLGAFGGIFVALANTQEPTAEVFLPGGAAPLRVSLEGETISSVRLLQTKPDVAFLLSSVEGGLSVTPLPSRPGAAPPLILLPGISAPADEQTLSIDIEKDDRSVGRYGLFIASPSDDPSTSYLYVVACANPECSQLWSAQSAQPLARPFALVPFRDDVLLLDPAEPSKALDLSDLAAAFDRCPRRTLP